MQDLEGGRIFSPRVFDPETRLRTRERRDLCFRCCFPFDADLPIEVVEVSTSNLRFFVRVHAKCGRRILAQESKPGWLGPQDTAVPDTEIRP